VRALSKKVQERPLSGLAVAGPNLVLLSSYEMMIMSDIYFGLIRSGNGEHYEQNMVPSDVPVFIWSLAEKKSIY
jgi:hypothetical protein